MRTYHHGLVDIRRYCFVGDGDGFWFGYLSDRQSFTKSCYKNFEGQLGHRCTIPQ